jgi:glutathione synthase/RimK-type ligase-like ATP-grasp enzyme
LEIALVTCARYPDLDPDDRLLIRPLEARGARVTTAVWDDPGVSWDRFDLAVVRSTWDYTDRRDQFVAWARAVPRLANPAAVIEWNTDKRYLADLAQAGLPVVPTTWIASAAEIDLPEDDRHVLKPAVGAGSMDAAVFDMSIGADRDRARAHAERLLAAGQTVMLQPYVEAIDEVGETGLVMIAGAFSHGIQKGVMLGPEAPQDVEALFRKETVAARAPSEEQIRLASQAIAMAPVPATDHALTYARVDLVPGPDGRPMIIELELTEPSLFMSTAPGSEERFADAIAAVAQK